MAHRCQRKELRSSPGDGHSGLSQFLRRDWTSLVQSSRRTDGSTGSDPARRWSCNSELLTFTMLLEIVHGVVRRAVLLRHSSVRQFTGEGFRPYLMLLMKDETRSTSLSHFPPTRRTLQCMLGTTCLISNFSSVLVWSDFLKINVSGQLNLPRDTILERCCTSNLSALTGKELVTGVSVCM